MSWQDTLLDASYKGVAFEATGDTLQALEHAEQFGFTGHPPTGSDCIVLPLRQPTSAW